VNPGAANRTRGCCVEAGGPASNDIWRQLILRRGRASSGILVGVSRPGRAAAATQ